MKNNNQVDISLIFFSFAFFIVIIGLFSKLTSQKNSLPFQQKKASVTPIQQKKNTQSTVPVLDYNAPITCEYKTKESSISAHINSNSIAVTHTGMKQITQKYVVEGDCLYSWNRDEQKGKKKCGVGGYIKIGRQLLSSQMGSIESMMSMFKTSQVMSSIDLNAVAKSCKNSKEIKKEVFVIPKKILFE